MADQGPDFMQRITFLLLAAALCVAMGCNRNQKQAELAPVPAPPPDSADPYADPYAQDPVAVAPAPEPEPIVIPPAESTYTIAKGDTLWSIAKREYGNGQRWKDIAEANPGINPNKLRVGQQITLP
jgi:5'-nucleotidase